MSRGKKLTLPLNRLSIFVILGALFLSVTTTLHAGRPAQSTNPQLSSGITFRRGTDGQPRAFANFSNFYIAPMEHVELSATTFFVFEAPGLGQITPEMITYFPLPGALQGAQADLVWATGSQTPFPFVFDPARQDTRIIQLFYASAGIGSNKRPEFMMLLHQIYVQ